MNEVLCGNNLELLEQMDAGSVDLVITDPPYCSNSDYKDKDGVVQFTDKFASIQEYMEMMDPILAECHRVLKDTGSLYLIVDASASHYLKVELDSIFGIENFRRHINWPGTSPAGVRTNVDNWIKSSYHILFYTKSESWTFNKQLRPYKPGMEKRFNNKDEKGNFYIEYRDIPGKKYYLKKEGVPWHDDWVDIDVRSFKDGTGYPTQKPLKLLERIILASSNETDLVLDPFCGSGTTLVAAKLNHRDYIGMDKNPEAVRISQQRLENCEIEKPCETALADIFEEE